MKKRKVITKDKASNINELVSEWTEKSSNSLELHGTLDLLFVMRDYLYSQYQPFPEQPDYIDRLFAWVNQVASTSDKKTLFELAAWLLFVGSEEMHSLYRSSYADVVTRWVIDDAKIDITASDANEEIKRSLSKTFFGSIAGMDMGTYCRLNGIQGQSFRPDFREHCNLGSPNSMRNYLIGTVGIHDRRFDRIVAVEDFVGSGQQMEEAAKYLSQLTEFPVLLSPILVATEGFTVGLDLERRNSHVSFRPLFPLPRVNAVPYSSPRGLSEPPLNKRVRKLLKKVWPQTEGKSPTQPLYGPFGCGGVGSLVLTYLNCPDNVPPAIHHKSDTWEPLFRRASREI